MSAPNSALEFEIVPESFTFLKVTGSLNAFLHHVRKVAGIIGLIVLTPILLVIAPIVYFVARRLIKRAIDKIKQLQTETLYTLQGENEPTESDIRKAMVLCANLGKAKHLLKTIFSNREEADTLFMKELNKMETSVMDAIVQFEKDLNNLLYPNLNKEYSQEELIAMAHRSEGVTDLDDEEVDAYMQEYLS